MNNEGLCCVCSVVGRQLKGGGWREGAAGLEGRALTGFSSLWWWCRVEVGSAVGQLCNDPGARLLLDATTMGLLPTADGQQQQPEGRARRRLLTR